ncbi:MAG: PPOX class F420-dependent oxidoreductase [Pseudonocardia sp.]
MGTGLIGVKSRVVSCSCRTDGRPHVVPVWFVLDGDDLLVTTGKDSVKGRALRRDGRVALCVDDGNPPYAFVLIEGRATTTEEPAEVLGASIRNAVRYVGQELAAEYGALNAGDQLILARITPEHVVAENNITEIG